MERNIHVWVVLFASHREIFGESRVQLDLAPGSDLDAVYSELASRVPRMADLRPFTTFALNREVVGAGTPVCDGDEVALLQPVSGGCGD